MVRIQGGNAEGRVVFIGLSAEKSTGLVPVLVRLANPKGRLRGEVAVQVRFTQTGQ